MPWKVCSAMEERLRFIARLIEGEAPQAPRQGNGLASPPRCRVRHSPVGGSPRLPSPPRPPACSSTPRMAPGSTSPPADAGLPARGRACRTPGAPSALPLPMPSAPCPRWRRTPPIAWTSAPACWCSRPRKSGGRASIGRSHACPAGTRCML
jgi:hypothetical protein